MKTQIYEWLGRINEKEELPDDIIAFNFGIFESPAGYSLYLTGSGSYDPNDDDWATEVDYTPEEKYLFIKNDSKEKITWNQFLTSVTDIIKGYIESEDFKTSILNKSQVITVGFDDGDLVKIK